MLWSSLRQVYHTRRPLLPSLVALRGRWKLCKVSWWIWRTSTKLCKKKIGFVVVAVWGEARLERASASWRGAAHSRRTRSVLREVTLLSRCVGLCQWNLITLLFMYTHQLWLQLVCFTHTSLVCGDGKRGWSLSECRWKVEEEEEEVECVRFPCGVFPGMESFSIYSLGRLRSV